MHQKIHTAEPLCKNSFQFPRTIQENNKAKLIFANRTDSVFQKGSVRADNSFSPELSGNLCNCSLLWPSSPIHPFSIEGSLKYWNYTISCVQSYASPIFSSANLYRIYRPYKLLENCEKSVLASVLKCGTLFERPLK